MTKKPGNIIFRAGKAVPGGEKLSSVPAGEIRFLDASENEVLSLRRDGIYVRGKLALNDAEIAEEFREWVRGSRAFLGGDSTITHPDGRVVKSN